MDRWRHIVGLSLAIIFAVSGEASAQETTEAPVGNPILATVAGTPITELDVQRVLETRRREFPGDTATARQRALEQIIAERALDAQYGDYEDFFAPTVLDALEDARRQVLFQSYVQTQFKPDPPTDEDIAAYVAANPKSFADRQEYRFLRLIVQPEDANERRMARNGIATLSAVERVTADMIDRFEADMRARAVALARQPFWGGGDALPSADLERLARIQENATNFDMVEHPQGFDLIHLIEVRDAPHDPALFRQQVEARIQLKRLQELQAIVARDLAMPYLSGDASDANDETAPTDTARADTMELAPAALLAFGFSAGLALLSALRWVRSCFFYQRERTDLGAGTKNTRFLHRRFVSVMFTMAAIFLVALSAWALYGWLPPDTGVAQIAVMVLGSALVGIATIVIYGFTNVFSDVNPIGYAIPALFGTVICVSLVGLLVSLS